MLVTPYRAYWETSMTDARPFTVVCIADDSRSTERVDLVENTFVAFVMPNVSKAISAGRSDSREWLWSVYRPRHHRNVNDDPDEAWSV